MPKADNWWRGWLVLGTFVAVVASSLWEQYSKGENKTPELIASYANWVLGGVLTLEGVVRVTDSVKKKSTKKEGTPADE